MRIFCPKCKAFEETSEARIKHGKKSCLKCAREVHRAFVRKRKEIDPTFGTGKYPDRREKTLKSRKERRRADPEYREAEIAANHKARLKRLGVTIEQYEKMVETQSNLCAICGQPETRSKMGRVSKLAVDHDHETGKVRALLCYRHNIALGALSTPEIARRAITYLKQRADI